MSDAPDPETAALPPLDEVLAALRVVAIPTRTRFRGISVREAAILDSPLGRASSRPSPNTAMARRRRGSRPPSTSAGASSGRRCGIASR
jgi:hypothetical protein